jgi:flagellar protein FlbD
MIKVHRLNGSDVVLNAELVESIEAAPDTVIALVTGNRMVVQESVDDVVEKIIEYRKKVNAERKVINPTEGLVRK